jgi:hypothetical protein
MADEIKPLGIEDVIKAYREKRSEAVHPDFRNLVEALRKSGYSGEISNHDYLDALFLTDLMFKDTRQTLRILCGSAVNDFIEVLNDSFESALKKIMVNSGQAKVILFSNSVPMVIKQFQEKYNILKVFLARSPKPMKHFIVCDSRMLRLEEIHEPLKSNTPSNAVNAAVYFNNGPKSRLAENMFESVWQYLEKNR